MIITQIDTPVTNQLYPVGSIQERVTNDLLETIQYLEERDREHLEIRADQEERIQDLETTLEAEQTAHEQTRQHLAELERRHDDLEHRHTEQHGHYADAFKWLQKLMANITIPPACKLVLLCIFLKFYFVRYRIVGEEMKVGVEETAQAIGMSTSTVRKATDKYQAHNVLTRRYEPYTTEKGEKRTRVHLTLNDIVLDPSHIELENEHGGVRAKGCKNTQCPTLDPMDTEEHREPDSYRAEYCDTCDTVMLDTLPGLRADADPSLAIKAIQEGRVQLTNRLYKMTKKVIDAIIPQSEQTTGPDVTQRKATEQTPALVNEISRQDKKQDAFRRGTPEQEIYIDPETEQLGQRFAAAVELLAELDTYGYTLNYQQDGQRRLTRNATIKASVPEGAADRIKTQIEDYNAELFQIWQDSQTPANCYPLGSSQGTDQEETASVTQSKASDQDGAEKQDAFSQPGQEPRCGICQEREATGTVYEHGEPILHYCKGCAAQATRPAQVATEQYPPLVQQVGARPPAGYKCQAATPLRADGQPAQACNKHGHADKVVGRQVCNGTRFFFDGSQDAYCCCDCWTLFRQ